MDSFKFRNLGNVCIKLNKLLRIILGLRWDKHICIFGIRIILLLNKSAKVRLIIRYLLIKSDRDKLPILKYKEWICNTILSVGSLMKSLMKMVLLLIINIHFILRDSDSNFKILIDILLDNNRVVYFRLLKTILLQIINNYNHKQVNLNLIFCIIEIAILKLRS
jgi:hypothetical protein